MLTAGRRHASAPDSSVVLYGAEMPPRNPASPHLEFSGFKEGMGMGMGLVPAFAETRLASAPMREGKMPVTVGELQFETQLDLMKAVCLPIDKSVHVTRFSSMHLHAVSLIIAYPPPPASSLFESSLSF